MKVVIYQPFPLKEQSWRFVAFETLITFLTIENNKLNVQTDSIRKTLGQESRFRKLFCFLDVCLVEFADYHQVRNFNYDDDDDGNADNDDYDDDNDDDEQVRRGVS